MQFLILLVLILNLSFIHCESDCEKLKTCSDCIGYAAERCAWCEQENMKKGLARCQSPKFYETDGEWCPKKFINNPNPSKVNTTQDNEFKATKGEEIQFRPQKIQIKLRPGIPVPFDMWYQPAKDYPLDLYFLMDNSYSMKKYAETLAKQAFVIHTALQKKTNNVRLGIGSFVEKPGLPYADKVIHNSYVFQHHLSLSKDMTTFKNVVNTYSKKIGSNYDSPEAGLDALMQVMTCENQIGWRKAGESSRRMIIVATESTYHSAGDGKMIGVYKPHDMQCHLNKENKYDEKMSLTLDYPSVSQIKYVAKRNNFKIIFAAMKNVSRDYQELANEITGAEYAELEESKILEIVLKAYETASQNVKLSHNFPPSFVLSTNCDTNPDECKSEQANKKVHITATLKATECLNGTSTFNIQPFGINDKLTVEIETDCTCECEKQAIMNSEDCNRGGSKQCGICNCDKDRSGDKCEIKCNRADLSLLKEQCKQQKDDMDYCNNQGNCECGKCICKAGFSGDFCQYNDLECRKTCPEERGTCNLGVCVCHDPKTWTNPGCSCPVSDTKCIGPFSKDTCSGRGACKCGKCICKNLAGKDYFGDYCESCKDCVKDICKQLQDYANCNYEDNTKQICDTKYNQTTVKEVFKMSIKEFENQTSATSCKKKLDSGNILVFKYEIVMDETDTARLNLMIQNELEEPPIAGIWVSVASVIGGIIIIGLATLTIWKILTNIYDKREYEKFCNEAQSAGFDVKNPVYQDPNVTYINPTFQELNN